MAEKGKFESLNLSKEDAFAIYNDPARRDEILDAYIADLKDAQVRNKASVPKGFYEELRLTMIERRNFFRELIEAYVSGNRKRCLEVGENLYKLTISKLQSDNPDIHLLRGQTKAATERLSSQATRARNVAGKASRERRRDSQSRDTRHRQEPESNI